MVVVTLLWVNLRFHLVFHQKADHYIIHTQLSFGLTWSLDQCTDFAVRFSLWGVLSFCVTFSIESKLEGWVLHLTHTHTHHITSHHILVIFFDHRWQSSGNNFLQSLLSTCFLLGPALEKSPKEKNSGCWEDTDTRQHEHHSISSNNLCVERIMSVVWKLCRVILFLCTLMSRLRPKLNLTKNQKSMPANITFSTLPRLPIPA